MYKIVLIKFSGEQLSGEFNGGIDPKLIGYLADEVRKALNTGCQIVMIAGGGNMVRGEETAGNGIKRVTADQMGMLSGLINSMAITDIFESCDIATRCLSNIFAQQAAESYSFRLAEKHLQKNRVVIVAGGIGRPYFTHDTAAVNIALELDCEVVLKTTKVDGVYDKDPENFANAVKLDSINYQQAVENPDIKVMDKAAFGLAMEHKMPIIVFDAMKQDNLVKVVSGDPIGTRVS
jgi:uridylate kinase